MQLAGNESQGKSREKVFTEFGATVMALLAEQKGVTSQTKLQELLEEEGFTISQNSIAHWLYGKYSAPPELPGKLVAALNLSEPQKMRLAVAYSYGQKCLLDGPDAP